MQPLISICIPTYKKPEFVVRCIQSVLKQSYKQVEIIISDDSPDEDIKVAIEQYKNLVPIFYVHNQPSLKSPKNWNAALDKATGDLVVLMHQDDWFHSPEAMQEYVAVFQAKPDVDFVFCQNTAVDEYGNETILQARPQLLSKLHNKPDHLLLAQVIGPPSNTMLRKNIPLRYDEQFIWLVDVDYYVRLFKNGYKHHYISKHLVNIGLHEDQTTVFCRANKDIIFKENILYAKKLEAGVFKDIIIYDYYWRLLRNYEIRTESDICKNGVEQAAVPFVILHMLRMQTFWPLSMLKIGLISKAAMTLSYGEWLRSRR
jgi:glycosyltransferase involved in cell wall biosynthesis